MISIARFTITKTTRYWWQGTKHVTWQCTREFYFCICVFAKLCHSVFQRQIAPFILLVSSVEVTIEPLKYKCSGDPLIVLRCLLCLHLVVFTFLCFCSCVLCFCVCLRVAQGQQQWICNSLTAGAVIGVVVMGGTGLIADSCRTIQGQTVIHQSNSSQQGLWVICPKVEESLQRKTTHVCRKILSLVKCCELLVFCYNFLILFETLFGDRAEETDGAR